MEYRRLGKSGLHLSALGLGSHRTFAQSVDLQTAEELMRTAYDAGVNFFDNAELYARGQSEILMGQVFKNLGWPRDSFCVSSKVFFGATADPKPTQRGLSRKHVVEACHQALTRLQLDYLDLYFCHRQDPSTRIEETVSAMDMLVRQGKVLYWGTSQWPAARIAEACSVARREHLTPPVVEQPEYNLFTRRRVEVEYEPLYGDPGIGLTTWSPLYVGMLAGRYNQGLAGDGPAAKPAIEWLREELETFEGRRRLSTVRELSALAAELGVPLAALSIAWCLKNPNVTTVILGASRVSQLRENLKALDVVPRLEGDILSRIEALARRHDRGRLATLLRRLADPQERTTLLARALPRRGLSRRG